MEATLDQNNANNPFIIEDHIVLIDQWQRTAGETARVTQRLFPQATSRKYLGVPAVDAHWTNDKPHVVSGICAVDSACSLVIDAGVEVYVHGGGRLSSTREGQVTGQRHGE